MPSGWLCHWYNHLCTHGQSRDSDGAGQRGACALAVGPPSSTAGRLPPVAFFEGLAADPFPHAITTAYYWSVEAMSLMLDQAGLDIAYIDRRQDVGKRPHAAILALPSEGPFSGAVVPSRGSGLRTPKCAAAPR